jgi:periplasmic protein TonB
MQVNGQDVQGSTARWSNRPPVSPHAKPSRARKNLQDVSSKNRYFHVDNYRSGNTFFSASLFKIDSIVLFCIVILMHAAALYLFTRITDVKMPSISVPLTVSFTLAEPAQEKPVIKPRPPKTQALPEQAPVQNVRQPIEESTPQIIPPQFDVAHLNNPVPDYPLLSKRLLEQGEVILRVYVTPEGKAGQVEVHTSSGYPRLDSAAKAAVERWKFLPARQGDVSVGAWALVPIQYILKS